MSSPKKGITDSICKGCFLYENNMYCIARKSPNIINCPCQNCIVKMICNIECQDYRDCEKESIDNGNK